MKNFQVQIRAGIKTQKSGDKPSINCTLGTPPGQLKRSAIGWEKEKINDLQCNL